MILCSISSPSCLVISNCLFRKKIRFGALFLDIVYQFVKELSVLLPEDIWLTASIWGVKQGREASEWIKDWSNILLQYWSVKENEPRSSCVSELGALPAVLGRRGSSMTEVFLILFCIRASMTRGLDFVSGRVVLSLQLPVRRWSTWHTKKTFSFVPTIATIITNIVSSILPLLCEPINFRALLRKGLLWIRPNFQGAHI